MKSQLRKTNLHSSMLNYDFYAVPIKKDGVKDGEKHQILSRNKDTDDWLILGHDEKPFVYESAGDAEADVELLNKWKLEQK